MRGLMWTEDQTGARGTQSCHRCVGRPGVNRALRQPPTAGLAKLAPKCGVAWSCAVQWAYLLSIAFGRLKGLLSTRPGGTHAGGTLRRVAIVLDNASWARRRIWSAR